MCIDLLRNLTASLTGSERPQTVNNGIPRFDHRTDLIPRTVRLDLNRSVDMFLEVDIRLRP